MDFSLTPRQAAAVSETSGVRVQKSL